MQAAERIDPKDFAIWLQGFAELNELPPNEKQWQAIRDHLQKVFTKITPERFIATPDEDKAPAPYIPNKDLDLIGKDWPYKPADPHKWVRNEPYVIPPIVTCKAETSCSGVLGNTAFATEHVLRHMLDDDFKKEPVSLCQSSSNGQLNGGKRSDG